MLFRGAAFAGRLFFVYLCMKRFSLILLSALAALISFSSCEGFGLYEKTDPSFLIIRSDSDTPVPIAEGDVIELKVGDYCLPAYTDGTPGWFGLVSEGKCIVEDTSVALYYLGVLYAIQGGETSVTAGYKENEIHFTVKVPGNPFSGKVYFTGIDRDRDRPEEDWEGRIQFSDLLIENGALTDRQCNLISSDSEGNLWFGVTKGNRVFLSCNGRELGDNASLGFPALELNYIPKDHFIRTKHGKLFYFNGKQYKVISTDGTVAEGTAEGNILDMDVDANGNLYLWTWTYMSLHVWIIAPDGSTTSHEGGTDRIVLNASLDDEGNEYFICKYGDNLFGIYKNGEHLYSLRDAYNPRMIVHGTDLWIASFSPDGDPDENGNITNWGVYMVKNRDIKQLATNLFAFGTIDFCITKSGSPYVLAGDAWGHFVYSDSGPFMFIPFVNSDNFQFAVID